jgi:hypothetical protein
MRLCRSGSESAGPKTRDDKASEAEEAAGGDDED